MYDALYEPFLDDVDVVVHADHPTLNRTVAEMLAAGERIDVLSTHGKYAPSQSQWLRPLNELVDTSALAPKAVDLCTLQRRRAVRAAQHRRAHPVVAHRSHGGAADALGLPDPKRRGVRLHRPRVGPVRLLLRTGHRRRRRAVRRRLAADHDRVVARTSGVGDLRAGQARAGRSARLALRPSRRRAARRPSRLRRGVARRLRRHRRVAAVRRAAAGDVSRAACRTPAATRGRSPPRAATSMRAAAFVQRPVLVRDAARASRASRRTSTRSPRARRSTTVDAGAPRRHAGDDRDGDDHLPAPRAASTRSRTRAGGRSTPRSAARSTRPTATERMQAAAEAVLRVIGNGIDVSRLSLGCAPRRQPLQRRRPGRRCRHAARRARRRHHACSTPRRSTASACRRSRVGEVLSTVDRAIVLASRPRWAGCWCRTDRARREKSRSSRTRPTCTRCSTSRPTACTDRLRRRLNDSASTASTSCTCTTLTTTWTKRSTEAYPALRRWRDEGVVGAIGAGMNFSAPLARIVREADVDCVLLAGQYTLLDQTGLDELLPLCARARTCR